MRSLNQINFYFRKMVSKRKDYLKPRMKFRFYRSQYKEWTMYLEILYFSEQTKPKTLRAEPSSGKPFLKFET